MRSTSNYAVHYTLFSENCQDFSEKQAQITEKLSDNYIKNDDREKLVCYKDEQTLTGRVCSFAFSNDQEYQKHQDSGSWPIALFFGICRASST
jgi:hypothetical protein